MKRRHRRAGHALLGLTAAVGLLGAAFLLYVEDHYTAEAAALEALKGTEAVAVTETEEGFLFDGPGTGTALIFYPGAKVDSAAYAPLMAELAGEGVDCFLMEPPFRLAFFGVDRAKDVMEQYTYDRWYIGGHSLGGAMAASYAADHPEGLDGLVLLAAYPTAPLKEENFSALTVWGSEDGVLSRDKLEAGMSFLPSYHTALEIAGGNHAWFGAYGEQTGDGAASISREEQWAQTVSAVIALTEKT